MSEKLQMPYAGVIMDVINAEQAKIARSRRCSRYGT